jgi:drug/metabolite transporter (DMT)-like permease
MARSSLGAERKFRSVRTSRPSTTTCPTLILLLLILVFTQHVPATVAFQNLGRHRPHHARKARSKSSARNPSFLLDPTIRARILQLSANNGDGKNDDTSLLESAGIAAAAAADRKKGLLILLTVPFAWGTFEPAVRYVYSIDPPINTFIFSLAYYTVASLSLVAAASLASSRASSQDATEDVNQDDVDDDNDGLGDKKSALVWPIQGGLELGTYLVVGNTLQVLGLKTVPADRAAFLLQLTTLFVPVLDAVFQRSFQAVTARTWIACVVALAGVGAMGLDDGGGGDSVSASTGELSPQRLLDVFSHLSSGDAFIIAAALAYTFHCLRLEGYAKKTSAVKLAASKACVETFLSALTVAGLILYSQNAGATDSSGQGNIEGLEAFLKTSGQDITSFVGSFDDYLTMPSSVWIPAVGAVLWTGLVTVAYTIYAQSYGQRRVNPTTANLIYTFQPVCTAIIAWALLGETLGPAGYVGGALIGSAALIVVAPEE